VLLMWLRRAGLTVDGQPSPRIFYVHHGSILTGVAVRLSMVGQASNFTPFTLTGPQLAISTAFKTFGSPGTIAALEWKLSVAELIMTTLTGSSTKSRPATSGV